jgi:hypothetical protein
VLPLTLTDVRNRVETGLDNTTLQRILTAAQKSIGRSAGNATAQVETFNALGNRFIVLRRRSSAITSIVERMSLYSDPVTLASGDYRKVGGYQYLRQTGSTNSASTWGAEVVVTYVPEVDDEVRDRATLDLVQIDVEFRAFDREGVGDWEGYQSDYNARRRAVLAQVREGASLV